MLGKISSFSAGRRSKWLVLGVWLVVGIGLAQFQPKLQEATTNESEEFLPASADATKVGRLLRARFPGTRDPAVLTWERRGGLSAADRREIGRAVAGLARPGVLAAPVGRVVAPFDRRGKPLPEALSQGLLAVDGSAAIALILSDPGNAEVLMGDIETMRERIGATIRPEPGGLEAHVTGPAGFATDAIEVFESIDVKLLVVTVSLVLALLLAIYRSPIVALVPLFVVGIAYGIAAAAVYGLIEAGVLDVNGQATAVLIILMFGAGTDYCLLIVSRYREELRRHADRHQAMALAAERTAPAILSAGGTVVAAMLVLLLADLNSTRAMGPVLAIGVAIMVLAGLTLLPALLATLGRRSFWPAVPQQGSAPRHPLGIWRRIGRLVRERPLLATVASLAVLALGALGNLAHAEDLGFGEGFRTTTDSELGQDALERHFEPGLAGAVTIVVDREAAEATTDAVERLDGVVGVRPVARSKDGELALLGAVLAGDPFSDHAEQVVAKMRETVTAVAEPGGEEVALVGGQTAENFDTGETLASDARLIVPLILLVIALILAVLLRAVVAPLYLVATVVVSFGFALGVSKLVFTQIFGMEAVDPSLPTFAFIFLVALGVDYNIFLISRVREEAVALGTREGVISGLATTGGVITSAGLILAGTFAAMASLPLEALLQSGFTVALGVLVDTFLVRTILVPSIAFQLGDRNWWPGRLTDQSVKV